MPGVIAWETHSGEDVERAIATYVCLFNRRAVRIRPSVGDGGMDVLVTNEDQTKSIYQIKKYATNLTSRQKADVEDSFSKMLEYTSKTGYRVREWHLVMPLDPTKENRVWFDEFTANCGFECFWDGRARVDGWAASMPEVGDYYFENGSARVRELVNSALSAARLADSTNWAEIKESVRAQQRLLDDLDPHYAYTFHSYSSFEANEPAFVYRPAVVMSMAEGRDGVGWVVMDVVAKHTASSQLAPITGTFTAIPKNQEEANALRAFFDYGIPLPKMSGRVSDTLTLALADEELKNRDGKLWTFHSPGTEYSGPETIRLRSRRGGQLELTRRESSAGNKGEHWEGRDRSGLVSLQYFLDYRPAKLRMSLSFTDEPEDRASVDDALAGVECLYDAARDDTILFIGNDGGAIEERFSAFGMSGDLLETLYTPLSLASALNRYVFCPITLPAALKLTRTEVAAIRDVLKFCDGKPLCYRYERWNCSFFDDVADDSEIKLVCCIMPLAIRLGGDEYRLGLCADFFVGKQVRVGKDGETDFIPDSFYGDDVIRIYPRLQLTQKLENRIVVCNPPLREQWLTAVEEVRNSCAMTQWIDDTCEDLLRQLEKECP